MRLDVARHDAPSAGQGDDEERRRWRAMGANGRASPFAALRLAAYRLGRGKSVALAAGLGMLVAVVLLCTVPLYNALTANLQLEHALTSAVPQERNIWIATQNSRIAQQQYTDQDALARQLGQSYLASFTAPTPTYSVIASPLLLLKETGHDYSTVAGGPQVRFEAWDYAAAAPHMRFIAGVAPQDTSSGAPQAMITDEMAQAENLHVGDTLTVSALALRNQTASFTITGIWTPRDPNDGYWNGFSFAANGSETTPAIYPVLTTYNTFFSQLAIYNGLQMSQNWFYYTRTQAITTANLGTVASGIVSLRTQVGATLRRAPYVFGATVLTRLDTTLQSLQQQQALLALPLYMIVVQVVGLALLFVAAMAGLMIEAQSAELATLKSRGSSTSQLITGFSLQGVLLAVVAIVAGPPFAGVLALLLVHVLLPPAVIAQTGVSPAYLAHIAQPRDVIVPAVVGALLGIGAVVFAVWQAARVDIVAFRRAQGRGGLPPFWQRYYLDFALAALCVVGYLELNTFGSVSERLTSGSISPLLLVAPGLLLLAGALLVLRLLPIAAGLAVRLASRMRGLTPQLAFAQIERSPSRYSRLTLLLVLAVGLGVFALAFDASLTQNERDRAAYASGADVRIQSLFSVSPHDAPGYMRQIARLPGVRAVTPVFRGQEDNALNGGNSQTEVLGIDPTTFAQVAGPVSWQSRYASASLDTLLAGMRANTRGASAGTQQQPVWALVSAAFAQQYNLKRGDSFTLTLTETTGTLSLVVGDIVQDFPTLYPARLTGSFVVVNLSDFDARLESSAGGVGVANDGPNEFWLRTSGDANQEQALLRAVPTPPENSITVLTLRHELEQDTGNPLGAGMRGLLLVGAITAALLAILGTLAQAAVATKQRARQFAVLRTLGMSGRQLARLLLGEQSAILGFGILGGVALGLVMLTATLPFLEFSDSAIDPTTLGVPPYQLAFDPLTLLAFFAALALAFILLLLLTARYASALGLGGALRLGED
jgi:putative ABC transport system permease protein